MHTLTYLTQASRVDLEKVHLISDFTRFTTDCHSLFSQPSHLDIGAAPIFASQSMHWSSICLNEMVLKKDLCCLFHSKRLLLWISISLHIFGSPEDFSERSKNFLYIDVLYIYKRNRNSAEPWIKSQKIKKLKARKKPKRRTPWIIMCSKWVRTSK